MKRETADNIVTHIREEISSLCSEGYEDAAFSGVYDDRWIDYVLKIAHADEKQEEKT